MIRNVLVLCALLALAACGNSRFVGFNNCSADGSPVWFEYPNEQGSYEGLNNGPCKRAT
jgi:hypothetical protein